MDTEKLFEIIDGLSKEERKQLTKLIETGFWQLKEKNKNFFIQLLTKSPDKRIKICQKEEQENNRNFLYKKSALVDIIEDFISFVIHRQNCIKKDIALANFYNERNLLQNYESKIQLIEKKLQEEPVGPSTSLYKFQTYEIMATRARMIRSPLETLPKMAIALQQFYMENVIIQHKIADY